MALVLEGVVVVLRFLQIVVLALVSCAASAANPDVRTLWRMLDYVAVDYRGAVAHGQVLSDSEYAEMKDFAETVAREVSALPATDSRSDLEGQARALVQAIAERQEPDAVARLARDLGGQLLVAYPVPQAPARIPDVTRGASLYATQCAGCHGATGAGDGPMAAHMTPPPIAFTDKARASERSLFALYQVVTQGLDGTAMPGFAQLPDEDRWALAFYIGQLAFEPALAQTGEQRWQQDEKVRSQFATLEQLTTLTPAAMAAAIPDAAGPAVAAYLRHNPRAIQPGALQSLGVVKDYLGKSLLAYKGGDSAQASRLAVAAYLDGFEPLEPALKAKDEALMRSVEVAMLNLRTDLANRAPYALVEDRVDTVIALLPRVESTLASPMVDAGSAFLGAFTILLREGLEALLIVVGILAFLRRTGGSAQVRYVHGGTLAALAGGVATWWLATNVISISGASREMTEGVASLFAAAVLVFVGIWMHNKSQAGAWQRYIQTKVLSAMSQGTGWFLFVLAFVVVYREVFETILFYVAMWSQGSGHAIIAGSLAAAGVLAVIAWAMLGLSARLPIAQFFSWSSVLMAILAVILTGKGIAAVQEAGWLSAELLALPRVEWIGFYPTLQGLLAQVTCSLVLVAAFIVNRRIAQRAGSQVSEGQGKTR
ncbi:MAG: FTR1 family protein [Gammaproteobacteria bacterium]